jgi:hypothetical protein
MMALILTCTLQALAALIVASLGEGSSRGKCKVFCFQRTTGQSQTTLFWKSFSSK